MANVANMEIMHGVDGKRPCFKVDWTSILGNPFPITKESDRDTAIKKYKRYFNAMMNDEPFPEYPRGKIFRAEFKRTVLALRDLDRQWGVTLLCWCSPKRCHADVIADWLNTHWGE